MSNDLKRVGLVFTQEGAVDFKKTLQDINIEMNKNYNQFKLTQAQWDNSTKGTEKLRQEQEYLKNAYEIQIDKVNTLKMQLSDLENAENKNTTAIKKKQNELTNAEVKLENYKKKIKDIENQLNSTGKKMEEWGKTVENNGKKVEEAGKKMSAFSIATGTAMIASAKTAIDFEEAFTGVEKTVDGTAEQMEELKQGIRDMAKEIPSSTTEISAVAEAAGQLGIKTEDILSFTRVMIDLGNSTNLSAEEAASALAKFANVTKMSAKDYDKLGATIVALGNNFATTEKDIVEMATRLAATGELAGLSQSQILSLATAMSSVGIEAEAGGSAMSKLLKKIQLAVELGGDDLKQFAKVAGMSVEDFKKAYEKDAVKALSAFIGGLNDTERNGKSAIAILNDMGLTEVRLSNTILSLANASDVMNKAVDLGNEAWEDNTALTNEANKRYDTLKSKISIAINKVKDLAITFGNKMMPTLEKVINQIGNLTEWVANLNDGQVETILKIGAVITAIGPLLTIFGRITSTLGGAVKGIGTFTQAIGVMRGTVTTTSTAVNGLVGIMSSVLNPTTLAIAGITALGVAFYYLGKKTDESTKMTKEQIEAMKKQQEIIERQKDSLEQLEETQKEYLNSNLSEIENINRLKDELNTLVDTNGKVKEGYEGRVKFILSELNNALGTEYSVTGNVVQKYNELSNSIDNLIAKKKANIILQSQEEKYKEAIENQSEAIENLASMTEQHNKDLERKNELEKEAQKIQEQVNNLDITLSAGSKKLNAIKEEMEVIDKRNEKYEEQEKILHKYYENISNYETNAALIASGTAEDLEKVNNSIVNSYQQRKDNTIESLKEQILLEQTKLNSQKEFYKKNQNDITKNQIQQSQKRLEELVEELKNGTSTVGEMSTEQIQAWKILATGSYDTYYDIINNMKPELRKEIEEMTGVIAEKTPTLVEETKKMSQGILEQIEQNEEFNKIAVDNLKGMLNGLQDNELQELLQETGIQDVDKVIQGIREGNLGEEQGKDILSKLNDGLNNKNWKNNIYNTARNIVSNLSKILTVKITANGAIAGLNAAISALPGHKSGLDYVPKDDYVARLHEGERVLTKEENKAYTEAENSSNRNDSNTINYGTQIDYNKMASAMLKALTGCRFTLEEDGIARIVKDEMYKVV